MIGQQLGARHGHRLLTLTLANTTASMEAARAAWAERIAIAQAQGMAPLVEPTLQRWFTATAFAERVALVEKMRAIAQATSVAGFVGAASAIRDLDQANILAKIATPTLVVAGSEDQATPLAQAQGLQSGIADAALAVLPAAHQAAAERPGDFVAIWGRFVDVV